jgi:hypothetical protein
MTRIARMTPSTAPLGSRGMPDHVALSGANNQSCRGLAELGITRREQGFRGITRLCELLCDSGLFGTSRGPDHRAPSGANNGDRGPDASLPLLAQRQHWVDPRRRS